MKLRTLCTPLLMMTIAANAQNKAAFTGTYPATKTVTQTDEFFGKKVADPYRWLENDMADDTKDWVKSENEVTDKYLSQIPFRNVIKQRLTELWNYEKYTAPFKEGDYTYFYKNDGLQNQYVLYRQKGNSTPEVFLDPNKFSADGTTSLAGIEFSKDGSLCAYQISEAGSDWRKVFILDTKTKKQIGETMVDIKFSGLSWRGNEGFYYSSYDKPKGSALSEKTQVHKLFFHKLGTKQSQDALIFGGEKTPRRYIGGGVTEDQKYLVISAANATYGNELYIQDLSKKDAPIVPIVTGFENEQDVVYAENGKLYLTTNRNAPNRKLVVTDANNPTPEHWKNLIPETEFPLTVSTGGKKFFAQYIKDAVSQVFQYNLEGKKETEIKLPGLGAASGFSGKREEKEVYYTYTSYTAPATIFKYDIADGKTTLYKTSGVKINGDEFESKQVFYPSKDGTLVPMIITYKKGMQLNGKNPVMLYGYGGFNISLTPSFSVSNTVFMENGGVYAVANLRGGGEYGDKWHNAGTKTNKQNVFDDFIAAGEYLIKENYTSKDYLAISGGSNGGLLVGACMTQRPDLYKVCFPAVGVLDMLRYHKFTAGAGWAYDYGTADDSKEMFDYLYKYSPVHNVKKGDCYPATMVMTGDHDDRVVPAHSFKFAAELQAAQSCTNPTLIRIETKAGHGAGKPTSMLIDEQADKWAFMLWNMGLSYNR
ncbi:prolyl oligopeptidase family serine peptidase [Taibaiella soli]|uniref:prolyl oligopeptidase n=1 Tax=Taibaiella soli TaxID=1649169 RepID=A0A2W2AGW0_9BACT|nr:prolyl oligopeptidase family serine peptidase [Taibaiella soli]PZF74511.1 S9 family peptidase [Taibaiella soli]